MRKTAEEKQAETRSRLIAAATETFRTRGYLAASLDEISELAGFSTGAIYSNFANKEFLFLAAMSEVTKNQTAQWDGFLAEAEELGVGATTLGKTLVAVLPERKWRRAVIAFQISPLSEESRRAVLDSQRLWRSTVLKLLELVCSSNKWTPQAPLEDVAEAVTALADGLSLDALIDPDIDIARIFASTVTSLLDGPAPSEIG